MEQRYSISRPLTIPPHFQRGIKNFMQVTGTFLLYAWGIDSTMIPALSDITSEHNPPTKITMKWVKQFLDYSTSQEEAIITSRASGMVLVIHSDASYLSKNNSRIRAGGQHFLSSDKKNLKQRRRPQPINNNLQRHDISSRGRTWSIIFEYQNSSPHAQDARRAGPSTTTNTHPYRQ